MTISTTASRISHNGNGATTAFSFPYLFLANADLVVIKVAADGTETTLVLNTGYTVTGAGEDAGGTVTIIGTAPASGTRIVIYRSMEITQEVDYITGDAFPAETHERALDRLTMIAQQQQDAIDRCAKLSETSTADADTLIANINTLAAIDDDVSAVAAIDTDVSDVAAIDSNVTTVAGIAANVTTVAGIAANVTSVAGNATNINAVAGNSTNINAVAANATNINAVNANKTNIDAVAANETNIDTVAGISSDVTTVAGIDADVTAVAGNETDISTVADSIADVNTAATNIAAIIAAPTQATNAANSAIAAAASAAAAAASYDSFDDRYLGSKTSDPTVDNDGNPLVTGALYYSSTEQAMKVYDGATWILASSAGAASMNVFKFVATAGQTTFSGAATVGGTMSYTSGNIIVFMNGAALDAADYTASNGTSVVLGSAASLNDELVIVAFKSFTVADTYSQTAADARFVHLTGAETVAGVKTFSSKPVLSAGADINGATVNTNSNWGAYINPKSGGAVGDFTITDPTGNYGRLNIDTSGRVTLPYQPCLVAITTSSKSVSTTASLQFDSISLNRNSAITVSLSNSRFTVPVTGYYVFAMSAFMSSTNDGALDVRVNGVTTVYRFGSNLTGVTGTASNLGTCISVPLSLSAGDFIEVFGSTSKTVYGGSPTHTQMSLTLIG